MELVSTKAISRKKMQNSWRKAIFFWFFSTFI